MVKIGEQRQQNGGFWGLRKRRGAKESGSGRGREWLCSQAGQGGWDTREDLKEAAKGQSLLCRTDGKSWSAGRVGSRVCQRDSSHGTGAHL